MIGARKLETFLDMMPGDVVVHLAAPRERWLFWMDTAGDLFTDVGVGKFFARATQNHWLTKSPANLTLLAEGIETVEDLREWEYDHE